MKKYHYILIAFVYFFLVLGLYTFIDNPMRDAYATFFQSLGGIFCIAGGIYVALKYGLDNYHGRSFLIITVGVGCWFLGDMLWFFTSIFTTERLFPSPMDFIYLLGYPILFYGLGRELFINKLAINPKKYFWPAIVSFIYVVAVSYFGVYKAYSAENTILENALNIIYGVGDLLLAILALYILLKIESYEKAKFYYPWIIIFIGISLYLIADILYYIFLDEYLAGGYYYFDLIWVASYAVWGYGLWNIGYVIKEIRQNVSNKLISK